MVVPALALVSLFKVYRAHEDGKRRRPSQVAGTVVALFFGGKFFRSRDALLSRVLFEVLNARVPSWFGACLAYRWMCSALLTSRETGCGDGQHRANRLGEISGFKLAMLDLC